MLDLAPACTRLGAVITGIDPQDDSRRAPQATLLGLTDATPGWTAPS